MIGFEQEVDGLEEGLLGQLRQGQPARRAAEALRMGVRPKGRHPAVRLPESLQPFEHRLGVMEDRGPWIEGERCVGCELGVVPAAGRRPADPDHVLGEDAAETRVGQPPLALRRRHSPACRAGVKLDRRGARAHRVANTNRCSGERAFELDGGKEAGSCDPASREEGRGSCLELPRGCDRYCHHHRFHDRDGLRSQLDRGR